MSINKITFLSQFISTPLFIFHNPEYAWFYFSDAIEIKLFLNNLESEKCYVLTFELFISELVDDDEDMPVITLCKPILVTKNSNPNLLSKFLLHQISLADDRYDLSYDLIKSMRLTKGAPYIRVKYTEINFKFHLIPLINNLLIYKIKKSLIFI